MALVPVVAVIVLTTPERWELAVAVFAIASVSDALDGHIARARDCISTFGTVVDPLADKLLIGAALFALVAVDRAHLIVAIVIVARELAVSVLRVMARRRGLTIAASPFGKAKMAFQVAMVVALMAFGADPAGVQALVYATVGVTVASGLDYVLAYRRRTAAPHARGVPAVASTEQV